MVNQPFNLLQFLHTKSVNDALRTLVKIIQQNYKTSQHKVVQMNKEPNG
jgi:hypothetical protein